MIIDKIFAKADDHSKSMQERLFSFFPYVGLLTLFVVAFIGILVEDNIINTIILASCFIIFTLIVLFTVRRKKIQTGATLIAIVMVIVLMPIAFIFGGGLHGGSPCWFIFGFAYIGMTVEGRRKYVLMGLGMLTAAISYYVAYAFPKLVAKHTEIAAYFDSFSSIILVSGFLTIMILFENRVYRSENELIEKQRKEIEELSNARNSFFSSISHEIRTPIDSIIGFNELILREDITGEVLENSQNIRSASKLLLSLVNDILDLSKLESGKMEIIPVDYDSIGVISESVNMIWDSAMNKGLAVYLDISPDIPSRLFGDNTRIEQVLINVLNNAVKYTNEGSIKLSVQCKRLGDRQAMMIYSAEDTGIGIKRDKLPYLFDEFQRINNETTRTTSGSGLGLTIAKQLVEQMNGEILVNSIYTKGSTFIVKIPQEIMVDRPVGTLDLEDIRRREEKQFYRQSFEAPSARILIVDDNELNRLVTAKLLRDTKMTIDLESNGNDCLEKCSKIKYDCIFMDQEMPEMDGIECLRLIRAQVGGLCKDTPIVVMTAHSDTDDQTRFRMAGFDGYLLKPINGEMLENTLLRVLPAEIVHRTSPKYIDPEEQQIARNIKQPVIITTESVCDLPKELLEKMRVPKISFYIKNKNGVFLDGIEVETEGVLRYMEEGEGDLVTEPPTADDYEEFFASHLSEANNIIHISMSSKASDAYKNAVVGASAFDNVTVVDSENLSSGLGLLVIEATKLSESGKGVEECVRRLNNYKKKIHCSFLIDDSSYLAKKGRVSPRMSALTKTFMVRPSILFKDGIGRLDRMIIGPIGKGRKKYISNQIEKNSNIDKDVLFITHAGLTQSEIDDIRRWVGNYMLFDKIYVQKESAAMAAIHGEKAFGLIYNISND